VKGKKRISKREYSFYLFFNSAKAGRDLRYLYLCKNKLSLIHQSILFLSYTISLQKRRKHPNIQQPWIHPRTCPWIWNHQDLQEYRIYQNSVSVLPLREALQILWETLTGLLLCHKLEQDPNRQV
jgi:hypothetical protein